MATQRPSIDPGPGAERRTVALVIPLYNEEAVVPLLVRELDAFRQEHPEIVQVVYVDDGSDDATARLIREHTGGRSGATLISFSRNFGHQLAVTAGLHFVEADAAVVLDADLQDPLPVVARMIDLWRGGYDVVYGVRRRRQGETRFKRATAALFYRLFRRMTDLDMPLDAGDFRLMSRSVIDAYRRLEEQQPFVRGLVAWLGFNQTGVEYERLPRAAGTSHYSLKKMVRLALNSLTAFSDKPLRMAARFGMWISALSFVGGFVWVVLAKFVFGTAISGWASLLVVMVFLGGIQLFFLGVVGTYLARVYEEVKARPRYVIRDRWVSADEPPATEAQGTSTMPLTTERIP